MQMPAASLRTAEIAGARLLQALDKHDDGHDSSTPQALQRLEASRNVGVWKSQAMKAVRTWPGQGETPLLSSQTTGKRPAETSGDCRLYPTSASTAIDANPH